MKTVLLRLLFLVLLGGLIVPAVAQNNTQNVDFFGYRNGQTNISHYDPDRPTAHMVHKDSVMLEYKVLKQYYSGLLELQKDSVDMMDVFDDISFNSGRQFTIFGHVSPNCSVHCESFTYDYLVDEICYQNQYLAMKELDRYIILGENAEEEFGDQILLYTYRPRNVPASKFDTLLDGVSLSAKVKIIPSYNQLLLTGTLSQIKQTVSVCRMLDRAVERIFLELLVVEYNHGNNFQWDFDVSSGTLGRVKDVTYNPKDGFVSATYDFLSQLRPNFKVNLSALVSADFANIVTNPRMMALNNEEATFTTADSKWLRLVSSGLNGNSTTFQKIDASMNLRVTPKILSDQLISLDLFADKTEFTGTQSSDNIQTSSSTINTKVILKNGETLIIGGLIKGTESNTEGGFPVLSKIPFFGALFSNKSNAKTYKETVMYITPYMAPLTGKAIESGVSTVENLVQQGNKKQKLIMQRRKRARRQR